MSGHARALWLAAVSWAVLVGAATAGAVVPPLPDSGITGLVLIGPVCPVEMIPPAPRCGDRRYVATLDFRLASTNRLVRTARSNRYGRFTVRLAPGTYVLAPRPGPGIARPLRPRRTVHVAAHRFTSARVEYDSGIRFVEAGLR